MNGQDYFSGGPLGSNLKELLERKIGEIKSKIDGSLDERTFWHEII